MTLHLFISMIVIGGDGDSFSEVFWVMLMVACAYGCGFYKDDTGGVILFALGFVFSLVQWILKLI